MRDTMVDFVQVVVGFVLLLAAYSVVRYLGAAHNDLMDAREDCERAWANVDAALQRRHDEVGTLLDLADEHVEREREVIRDLVEARERAIEAQTPDDQAEATVALRESVSELYGMAEEYPDLRSDDRFEELVESVRDLERRIEKRREVYNDAVASYNARLRKLPESVFASFHGFEQRHPFVAEAAAREQIDVRDRLQPHGGADRDGGPDQGSVGDDGPTGTGGDD